MKWILLCLFPVICQCAPIEPDLLELAQVTHVEHDGSLASLTQEAQKKWLRPSGSERWQTPDLDAAQKTRVLELAERLGFLAEVRPQNQEYTYCCILGATVGRMKQRLAHAALLWQEGIHFEHCVLLSGQRPLDPAIELVTEHQKTESEALHLLWETMELPEAMRALPVTFIDVPMIQEETGVRRPTTQDTFAAWLKGDPQPGTCLFISNQPFCKYQEAVAQVCLPENFESETVGSPADRDKLNGAVVLDTIARFLYFKAKQE